MYRADSSYGPGRQVLTEIWLSFFHGAKIGVLGRNGSGKSTLLRIMAGRRRTSTGGPAPGLHVGLWSRSRSSTRKGRARQRRGGVRERATCSTRSRRSRQARRAPTTEIDALLERAGERAGPDRAAHAWDLDRDRNARWTRCACRPEIATSRRSPAARSAASPCAGCCCRSPTSCCSTSRRTISTPRALHWLEQHPGAIRGHGRRRDARSLLPRQRRRLDSRARSRPRAFRSRATTRPGWSRSRRGSPVEEKKESARQKSLARELEWVRMSPKARAGQEQGPHHGLREDAAEQEIARSSRSSKSTSRPARGWATWSSRRQVSQRRTATGCFSRT